MSEVRKLFDKLATMVYASLNYNVNTVKQMMAEDPVAYSYKFRGIRLALLGMIANADNEFEALTGRAFLLLHDAWNMTEYDEDYHAEIKAIELSIEAVQWQMEIDEAQAKLNSARVDLADTMSELADVAHEIAANDERRRMAYIEAYGND